VATKFREKRRQNSENAQVLEWIIVEYILRYW